MTPWLLPRYGVVPIYQSPSRAQFAGAGSILEFLPADFGGAIWGSGLMRDEPFPLPKARVLAVRGHLTRERIGADASVALGDPGILAARWLTTPRERWDVGLVPHGHHRSHGGFLALAQTAGVSVRVINVHRGAASAARQIGSCAAIVTTSLHGLITADSFGVPAVWTTLDPPLDGGAFKFHDYESAVTPNRSRFAAFDDATRLADLLGQAWAAPAGDVQKIGDALEAALRGFVAQRDGTLPFPAGVARVIRRE